MGRRPAGAILGCMLLVAGLARAADPHVASVEPGRRGALLVCRLSTSGLPGERIASTLQSGLVSAVDLRIDLLDAADHTVAGHMVRLRLSYDLWDEVYTIAMGEDAVQLPSFDALADWLARPPWLPVAPLSAIAAATPLRLRAALRLHAIAPSEREQVEAMVAGPDGQEVSVGLSRLIRLFYKGGTDRDDAVGSATSATFRKEDLPDATD